MTVRQLKAIRLCVLVLIFSAPVTSFLVPKQYLALILVAMLLLLLLSRQLLRAMLVRLNRIAGDLMDPDLLQIEAEDLYRILRRPAIRRNMNYIHLYDSMLHDLRGEFARAVEDTLQIAFGHARLDAVVRWGLAYHYLRDGKPQMAKALIQQLMQTNPALDERARASQLHTLGLHHLEQGELRQAEERLQAALGLAKRPLTRLNCLYDLARLYEKMGVQDKALEHYRQAAMLGPKTWLGREAAGKAGDPPADGAAIGHESPY